MAIVETGSHTYGEVKRVINSAADDVLAAIGAPETGAPDIVNLLIDVALRRLADPDMAQATVEDCIRAGYKADPARVLEWCQVDPLVT